MKNKLKFQIKDEKELIEFLSKNKERKIINFLNLESLYDFSTKKNYRDLLSSKNHLNFIDGTLISLFLSLKKFKKIPKNRGPTFTKEFLSNPEETKNKKHFFILASGELPYDKLPHLDKKLLKYYYPPFIQGAKFSKKDVEKMSKLINDFKPDFVWLGISSPKQHYLAQDLFEKTSAKYFFTVGAAFDFLIGRKKEAPIIFNKLGIEWIYRGITDFRHSRRKILKSFVGLRYLWGGIEG